MEKEIYQQPTAELIKLNHPLTLFIGFSANGEIDDWEEGGEG